MLWNHRWNPQKIEVGQSVSVDMGEGSYNFSAVVTRLSLRETQKKILAYLTHDHKYKPLFVDVSDCFPSWKKENEEE